MAYALCRRRLNKYTVYYRQRQLCDRFLMIISVVQVSCQVYSYWDGQELASSVLNSSSSYWVGIRYSSVGKIRYSNIIQFYVTIKMFVRLCWWYSTSSELSGTLRFNSWTLWVFFWMPVVFLAANEFFNNLIFCIFAQSDYGRYVMSGLLTSSS